MLVDLLVIQTRALVRAGSVCRTAVLFVRVNSCYLRWGFFFKSGLSRNQERLLAVVSSLALAERGGGGEVRVGVGEGSVTIFRWPVCECE